MRQKKDKILIVALSSLILFSSSLALMMYLKKDKAIKVQEPQVVVYVTKSKVKKGTLIKSEDIQKKLLAKSYVSFSPLMPEEIVGKYAKVDFLAGEPLRDEKLTLKKQELNTVNAQNRSFKNENDMSVTNDSVSLSLELFKNIDYSLKSGDYIDIVTVKEKKSKNKIDFKTTYVALHVKIVSFLKDGEKQSSYLKYKRVKDTNEKVLADTIVLDMPPRDIKNLFVAYYSAQDLNSKRVYATKTNKGHLWMIKTKEQIDAKMQYAKNSLRLDKKVVHKRAVKKKKAPQKVLISYEKE